MTSNKSLTFKIARQEPELIRPAKPTPYEFKPLSDIDDQETLRFQIPVINFYRYDPAMEGKDPAKVIREAIAKALVYYYPFAGRLREHAARKLVVECTGEGVLFIEADADVTLKEFGDDLLPPFPCFSELLYNVPGSDGVVNCPLLLIQVTRLKCGGFTFALRLNHTMSDAFGLTQFMSAIGEIARGKDTIPIMPVWDRHLLDAENPPRVTCRHREYDIVHDTKGTIVPFDDLVHSSFFFGPAEVVSLRLHVPPHLQSCSTVELVAACIWRCRTIAISPDPDEDVRIIYLVSARTRSNPPIPLGYYGNAFALTCAISKSKDLCEKPLHYALELVTKIKSVFTEDYMKSVASLMVTRDRPGVTTVQIYVVSDVTRAGFRDVDFGWGKAVYGGPAKGGVGEVPGVSSFFTAYTNNKGEKGIAVPFCLPAKAMVVFEKELDKMLTKNDDLVVNQPNRVHIMSSL